MLFNERNYADQGPLCDIALAARLERDPVRQRLRGRHAWSSSATPPRRRRSTRARSPTRRGSACGSSSGRRSATRELEQEFARRYDRDATFLARWNQGWTRRQPREEIARTLGLDPSKKTAVIFSHVLWDANMFFGRDLFADQEEWFVESVRAACANDARELDRQAAPRERLEAQARPRQRRARRARRRSASTSASCRRTCKLLEPDTDISTWSLFDVTDFGVTIRGSIGFELPCFGKPALTAGTGFYSGRGFTVDSETADEYLGRLARIHELDPPTAEQRRAREEARVRAVQAAPDAVHELPLGLQAARGDRRPVRGDDRGERCATPEELARAEDLRRARRVGRALTRARLPRAVGRSCRCAAARAAGRPALRGAGRS